MMTPSQIHAIPGSRRPTALACLLMTLWAAGLLIVPAARASAQLRLGEHAFDWTTVEQDRAQFSWSAEVINESTQSFQVKVAVDLLDDQDAIVVSDSTDVAVGPGQRLTVKHDGSLPFDRAADVVSFRFRLEPAPPNRR